MPTSDPTQISTVLTAILEAQPETILDVGIGHGKFGPLLREYLPAIRRLDGVEPWPAAIFPGNRQMYDVVVEEPFPGSYGWPAYDLVLLVDVVEHYSDTDGGEALRAALRIAPTIVVATPRRFSAQGAVGGNEYERHKSVWTALSLQAASQARGLVVYPHPAQLVARLTR